MPAEYDRKRSVRSVTLDDELVERFKAAGELLVPRETSLSRLLDRAMADFLKRNKPAEVPRGRKPKK